MWAILSMTIVLLGYHVGGSEVDTESYIELFPEKIPNRLENIRIIPPENRQCTQPRNGIDYTLTTAEGLIEEILAENGKDIEEKIKQKEYRIKQLAEFQLRYPDWDVDYESLYGEPQKDFELKDPLVPVVGSNSSNVYYDQDWGLFSSILASYNNHWPLRTSPDDWWNVVLRVVAQAMADHGDVQAVRDIFVEHQGQKKLFIEVDSLSGIDYSWLFEQFSGAIRKNIKDPEYVDVIENDFTTTTVNTKIVSQVMLMSSLQKYFSYGVGLTCGIPGIHMKGTAEDWEKLVRKLEKLDELLDPVKKDLDLENWFYHAKQVFQNLQQTFNGNPDISWWGSILTWQDLNGSGMRPHWGGWFPTFLGASTRQPVGVNDFPSGLVTVPVEINDHRVVETGTLLAGTLGFTVTENDEGVPVVEPNQVWSLLLPQESTIANQLRGI